MNTERAIWYFPGQQDQPAGPYTQEQIEQWLDTKRCSKAMLCWRQGMPAWRPLAETKPFVGYLARKKTDNSRRVIRIAMAIVLLLCLAGVGTSVCVIWLGPAQVRQARKLMASQLYEEAAEILAPLVEDKPLNHRTRYLLAVAQINHYACTEESHGFGRRSGRRRDFLGEATQNLSRALAGKPALIEKARTDMAAAASRIPLGLANRLERIMEIARVRVALHLADARAVAGELMEQLASSPSLQAKDVVRHDVLFSQILAWDPGASGRLMEILFSKSLSAEQGLRMMLPRLEQWTDQLPALKKPVAAQLLLQARSLYQGGHDDNARTLVTRALGIDPDCASGPDSSLLCIKLLDPGDTKLVRCQYFLKQWPKRPECSAVLMVMIRDAVRLFDQCSRWQRNKCVSYLAAGCVAAGRLMREYPGTPRLDVEVYEFAQRLAQNQQHDVALHLMTDLLTAVSDSPIALQVTNSIAEWRAGAGKGTLPPEFDELATQVEKDLRILPLSTPGALRTLQANPRAVHVVQVAWECTIEKFNSQEMQILKDWVAEGGILWVTNNVLQLFDIRYDWGRSNLWINWRSVHQCRPAVIPTINPIVAGCSQVVLRMEHFPAANLNFRQVIPLLSSEGVTSWSLIPYGRGWVSDVKSVDSNQYDGARFWLNFRLFCLGRPIPGAPAVQPKALASRLEPSEFIEIESNGEHQATASAGLPVSVSGAPVRVVTAETLKQMLTQGRAPAILWTGLSRSDLDAETRNRLRHWVEQGGVLWVETDLAWLFGFRGLRRDTSVPRVGQGEVPGLSHSLLAGCNGARVAYEISAHGVGLGATQRDLLDKHILPVLLTNPLRVGELRLMCAGCPFGEGYVFLRPKTLQMSPGQGGHSLEARLLEFSRHPTRLEWPGLDQARGSVRRRRMPYARARNRIGYR